MSGISSSFGGNENIKRIQGMAFSGFITNIIALICTYYSKKISIKYQFLLYIIFADIFIIYFIYKKIKFFKMVENEKKSNSNFEEIELSENQEVLISDSPISNEDSNSQTLSEYQNIVALWSIYLNILLCFFSTFACYPSLIFKFDLSSIVSFRYKFILITFFFNIGDISGRLIVDYILLPLNVNYILNIFKFSLIFVSYLVTKESIALFSYQPLKLVIVFVIGLINGYIPCAFFINGRNHFKDSPENMFIVGKFYNYSIQIGILLGSSFAYFVF